jgi:hypothetical protein
MTLPVIGLIIVAAMCLLTLAIYIALRAKTSASKERKDHRTEDLADATVSRCPDGDAFAVGFQKHIAPHTDKYFITKNVGASFPNADGSSRPLIIKKCEPMELLRLELDLFRRNNRWVCG